MVERASPIRWGGRAGGGVRCSGTTQSILERVGAALDVAGSAAARAAVSGDGDPRDAPAGGPAERNVGPGDVGVGLCPLGYVVGAARLLDAATPADPHYGLGLA